MKFLLLQIWRVAQNGTNIQVLLDKKDGITGPTWLRSNKETGQLTVINSYGFEIQNYNTFKVTTLGFI